MHCPICGKRFVADLEAPKEQRGEAPFCSDRCRKIDLSHWLD
ncbi:MAG: DNA gyrase inhibitor YacG, partial [Planctomycetota bacterium]